MLFGTIFTVACKHFFRRRTTVHDYAGFGNILDTAAEVNIDGRGKGGRRGEEGEFGLRLTDVGPTSSLGNQRCWLEVHDGEIQARHRITAKQKVRTRAKNKGPFISNPCVHTARFPGPLAYH